MNTKSLSGVTIKDADQGTVEAVFSTFGVRDLDGDVVVKGAMRDGAQVIISGYGHTSWDGHLPIGTGTIHTTDTEAILDGKFFLDTTHGRDAWATIKAVSEAGLQQWSYSLQNVVSKSGELDGKTVRFIESVDIAEVSPVLKGASIGTRTLAVKGETTKFSEHMDIALRDVKSLVEMAVERLALRAEQGKSIVEQTDALEQLTAALVPLKQAIDGVTQPTTFSPMTDAFEQEYLRFVSLAAAL